MQWTCEKCGLELTVTQFPVRCRCGALNRGEVQPPPDPVRPPRLPSLARMGVNFAKAATAHAKNGHPRSPWWEIQERQQICMACANYHTDRQRCGVCGCKTSGERVYLNKLAWADMRCPDKKWDVAMRKFWRTSELTDLALTLIPRLPENLVRVFGVARSGLIPATAIATRLHLPLYAICGERITLLTGGQRASDMDHVRDGVSLVIDDSVGRGTQMDLVRQMDFGETIFAAVFVTPECRDKVDLSVATEPPPHFFQWNLFNGPQVCMAGLDMDGVVCADGTRSDYELGELFLRRVTPLDVPRNSRFPAGAIITARPERYRDVTTRWLERHGAQCKRLVMWTEDEERRDPASVAKWKAKACRTLDLQMYVESDPWIAKLMREHHVRVLCPREGRLQ